MALKLPDKLRGEGDCRRVAWKMLADCYLLSREVLFTMMPSAKKYLFGGL